uniref:transcription factor IIIB 50 kDa subunit-like n=1 Tax=Myxine glutinosa TaxID=7769 RepID=UPI00358F025B
LQETVNVKWNLAKRTIQICELCGEAWLLTGRRAMPAIISATFLAWQSLYPRSPACISLKAFCRKIGVPCSTSVRLRVREMRKLLLTLAQALPWLIHRHVSLDSVAKFIDEVLSNQRLLLQQLVSQDSQAPRVQGDSPVLLNTTDVALVEAKCGNPAQSFLLPPCIVAPKKPPLEEPERCQQPFSNEISEAEIEQYIRTPEEVEEILRLQAAILNY